MIGIFRSRFLLYSETFIREQARCVKNISFVCCDVVDGTNLDVYRLCNNKLEKFLFYVFGRVSDSKIRDLLKLELIHAHFGQDGALIMPLADKYGIPLVVTFHGQDCTVRDFHKLSSFQISNLIYLLRRRYLFRKASRIIAVSEFVKSKLLLQGCPEEKICVHYIGVDVDKFKYFDRSDRDRNVLKILCVARHSEKKGIGFLLRAFAGIEGDVILNIVGGGELEDFHKKLALELGIESKVAFSGPQGSEYIRDAMIDADIFCVPSIEAESGDSEAFGIVFIEAAATGLPVVSTLHGGIPEAVVDGSTGFLCRPGNVDDLKSRLTYLIRDRQCRIEMGRNGRDMVERRFDISKQTRNLEEIYRKVIDE